MSDGMREFTGSSETLAARLNNRHDADRAGRRIEALGYDPRELSYISDATKCSFTFGGIGDHTGMAAAEGIVGGDVLGGALSAGAAVIGFGSLVLLGPIGLVTGTVIGGVSGILLSLGLSSDQAVACENAINTGSLVMTIQAHAGDSGAVRSVLGDHIIASENDVYYRTVSNTRDGDTA